VEPPYGHSQARDEDGQAVDPAQQPCAGIGAAGAKQGVDPPSTMATMMLKSTKYQYSLRLDLPLNTAYFFSASRYQLNSQPPYSPRSLGAHCDRRILARGAKACIQQRTG
jgi:hypothetical protein